LVIVVVTALGFAERAGAQAEIPDGFEVVEIVRSETRTQFPSINDCGEVAFDWQLGPDYEDKEIFHFDNGALLRVTHNTLADRAAEINRAGAIVWGRTTHGPDDDQIILWHEGRERLLDAVPPGDMSIDADINDLGWVVWARGLQNGCVGEVMLWDGKGTRRVSERNERWDLAPGLNGLGDVTWTRLNACVNPWQSEIRVFSEGRRTTLPSAFTQLYGPSINNHRQVAWSAGRGTELWQDGQTRVLTPLGRHPRMNNHGDIQFWRPHDDIHVNQAWLYRAADERFFRLVDDPLAYHDAGDINDWGEVVWGWNFGPPGRANGIMLMRRIRTGDAQFDGVIDARDYDAFAACMTGPGRVDRLCDCRFLDIDYDGDVDLSDFARFQNAYQGP